MLIGDKKYWSVCNVSEVWWVKRWVVWAGIYTGNENAKEGP
jgi:hypothetical protein